MSKIGEVVKEIEVVPWEKAWEREATPVAAPEEPTPVPTPAEAEPELVPAGVPEK